MRNTFVKLFLAVAMCFMIGSALVACGGDVDLGVNAEGYITINGEATDVKVSGNDVACKEHDVVVSVVKEHTADAEGVYLETCTLCNDYAKVVTETKHDYEDGVKQAATCFVDAFEGQVCKICGARGEGKTEEGSAGHDWSKPRAIDLASEHAAACINGGLMMKSCDDCGAIGAPEIVSAVGHVADNWLVTDYPTVDEVGEAKGKCIYCTQLYTYTLPAIYLEGEFNEAAYSLEYVDGVAPTCIKASQAVYTYKAEEAQNKEKVWNSNLKFNVKEDAPATGHFLAGKKAEAWKLSDGTYPYFADVNGNDKVDTKETLGITLFAGETLACGTADKAGYYTCTECKEIVKVNAVTVDHNGPRTLDTVAKCYAPGVDIVSCYLCKKDVEAETYAEHNYVYELVAYDAAGEPIEVVSEDTVIAKWVLTSYCDAKVPVKEEEEVEATATTYIKCCEQESNEYGEKYIGSVATKVFDDVDEIKSIKLQNTVESTCYAEGYKLYQYVDVDPDDENNKEYISVKVALKKAPHTLNGKTTDEYDMITVDIPGIKAFAAADFEDCGNWYDAYFTCSVCEKELKAGNEAVETAIAKTRAFKAHVFKYTPVEDAEATCTAPGEQEVICTYENCGEDGSHWKEEGYEADPRIIPALGHTYTYTANVSGTDLELTAVCSVCEGEGENAEVGHKVELDADLEQFVDYDNEGEKVTSLSCVSREVKKFTVMLAIVDDAITEATPKDPDAKVKEYVEQYTFSVTFNIVGDEEPTGHKYLEEGDKGYEESLIKQQVLMDWNKDGEDDQLVEYTYKHCPVCDVNELVGLEVLESYTDITYADYVESVEE